MTEAFASLITGARRGLEVGFAELDGREVEWTVQERWARDPVGWIDEHVVIASKFDGVGGRVQVRPVKMSLWPDQRATIEAWIDLPHLAASGELRFQNAGVLIEKSRQIGETWALAATVDWLLRYHRTRGLFMSLRKPEVADRGWTVDSFFGRVKFVDDALDRGALGLGAPLVFRPMSSDPATVSNPLTGSLVRGECQRDDPGRGSTFDWAIVDEAAHVAHGELVHAAIDDACPTGKVYLSTPEGDDNVHARLCDERPQGWAYLRLHWSTHPVYGQGLHVAGADDTCARCAATRDGVPWSASDPVAHRYPGKITSPWYDDAVIGKTDEQVAKELDIDRAGALSARVYPEFDTGLHVVADGIPLQAGVPVELAWDFGLDVTSVIVLQNTSDAVHVVGMLEAGDLLGTSGTPPDVCAELRAYLADLGVEGAETDERVTREIRSVGDPSERARSRVTGRSKITEWSRYGFEILVPPQATIDTTLTSVKLLLQGKPKHLRVCGVRGRGFAGHMLNNVWPTDATGQRRLGATEPLDNSHNHACRAFAYWAFATYPPSGPARPARGSSPARRGIGRNLPSQTPARAALA